jgi:hypothetical protein
MKEMRAWKGHFGFRLPNPPTVSRSGNVVMLGGIELGDSRL